MLPDAGAGEYICVLTIVLAAAGYSMAIDETPIESCLLLEEYILCGCRTGAAVFGLEPLDGGGEMGFLGGSEDDLSKIQGDDDVADLASVKVREPLSEREREWGVESWELFLDDMWLWLLPWECVVD
jgi:hypothetical protein